MFLEFYNLREQPFGVTPDPSFLYLSTAYREALSSLLYGIDTGQGFVALIANAGMGKTTILFRLHELLNNSARTAFVFQTQCTSREFIRYIAADLGIVAPKKGTGVLIELINQFLLHESNQRRRVVLVIDEAQNLDISVLETIRMLSNFETASSKLLQIVLAGQPRLAKKLMSPGLVQFRQRISTLVGLCRLRPNEIVEYIDHRLGVAGHTGPSLFSPDALSLISERSEGIPRNINTICFNALSLGYAKEQKVVSSETVREVVSDLDLCSLAVRRPVRKNSVEEETQPDPEAGKEPMDPSPPGSDEGARRSFLSFQTMGRILRWNVSATVCALLLVVYLTAWRPSPVHKAKLPLAKAIPDHAVNQDLDGRERTMTFTVVVKSNDTLSDICRLYLGDFNPSVAKEIRRLNPGLANFDLLQIGQQIRLPLLVGPVMSRRQQRNSQRNRIAERRADNP